MDRVDHHSLVGDALTPLIDGLSPFVAKVLTPIVPPGAEWPVLLRAKDAANDRRGGEYRTRDLSLMLRAMTERLGTVGYPFTPHLPRRVEIYARELREVRNQWAHNAAGRRIRARYLAGESRRSLRTHRKRKIPADQQSRS